MRITVRTNIDEVFRDVDAFFARVQTVAIPRALNTLRDQAQVAGLRKLAEIYQIGPRTMEKYVTINPANPNELEATITVKGRAFPLADFKPIQTRAGVSVTIKGRRHLIPHAFMVKRFGKHVFARGAYGGKGRRFKPTGAGFGRFLFGRGRLPINELFTMSPPEAFSNNDVVDAMQDRIEEQAEIVIEREIDAVRSGF